MVLQNILDEWPDHSLARWLSPGQGGQGREVLQASRCVGAPSAAIVETHQGDEGYTDRRDQIGSDLQLSWAVGLEIKA